MRKRTQVRERPGKKPLDAQEIEELLDHIYSLRVASRDEIGGGHADALVRLGLVNECWIGCYTLTEAGERKRLGKGAV